MGTEIDRRSWRESRGYTAQASRLALRRRASMHVCLMPIWVPDALRDREGCCNTQSQCSRDRRHDCPLALDAALMRLAAIFACDLIGNDRCSSYGGNATPVVEPGTIELHCTCSTLVRCFSPVFLLPAGPRRWSNRTRPGQRKVAR